HMETTFGATMGCVLGFGLWLSRGRISPLVQSPQPTWPAAIELALAAVHVALLVTVEFFSVPAVTALYDFGLILGFIPVVAVAGGRWWPYLLILPITTLPIPGKTGP